MFLTLPLPLPHTPPCTIATQSILTAAYILALWEGSSHRGSTPRSGPRQTNVWAATSSQLLNDRRREAHGSVLSMCLQKGEKAMYSRFLQFLGSCGRLNTRHGASLWLEAGYRHTLESYTERYPVLVTRSLHLERHKAIYSVCKDFHNVFRSLPQCPYGSLKDYRPSLGLEAVWSPWRHTHRKYQDTAIRFLDLERSKSRFHCFKALTQCLEVFHAR